MITDVRAQAIPGKAMREDGVTRPPINYYKRFANKPELSELAGE
jgi:hypothetical protein